MSIIVSLTFATICFTYQGTEECHPVLIGKTKTPTGEFIVRQRITDDPGYGGDVLQFYETETEVYAIHRLWTLNKKEKREQRIKSSNVKDRAITGGCINVESDVYAKLVECCTGQKLLVK